MLKNKTPKRNTHSTTTDCQETFRRSVRPLPSKRVLLVLEADGIVLPQDLLTKGVGFEN